MFNGGTNLCDSSNHRVNVIEFLLCEKYTANVPKCAIQSNESLRLFARVSDDNLIAFQILSKYLSCTMHTIEELLSPLGHSLWFDYHFAIYLFFPVFFFHLLPFSFSFSCNFVWNFRSILSSAIFKFCFTITWKFLSISWEQNDSKQCDQLKSHAFLFLTFFF